MKILEVKDVSKSYGTQLVLDSISMTIAQGKIYGLLGPNGAGKTTLIRIINQIISLDKGDVFFKGHPMKREFVEKIGYLPEERGLYVKMKVGEHLIYLARLKGMKAAQAKKVIADLLDEFDMNSWWNKKIEQLSKGMQQKLQFIISIMHQPDFVILDEPFTGFDPVNVELVKDKILNLRKNGVTFMLSTHRMESVEELCDSVMLINKAKKVLDGDKHQIKEKYSKNLYEIEFRGAIQKTIPDTHSKWSIVKRDESEVNGKSSFQIQLPGGTFLNEILPEWITYGNVNSVTEIIPSMHDIFISLVNENKDE